VEELYYVKKGDSLLIRRECDNENIIIGDIKVYTDFEMLQVEVPNNFFGTPDFSARRD